MRQDRHASKTTGALVRSCAIALALSASCGAAGAIAGTIVIDDFTKPDPSTFVIVPSGMNPTKTISETAVGELGGQRDIMYNVVGQGKPNSAVSLIGYDSSYSLDAFQLGTAGLAPTVVTLQYSGTNTENTPSALVNVHSLAAGAGIDLTDGGTNDSFMISFIGSDAQPTTGLDVSIIVTSPGGLSSTVSAIVQNKLNQPFDKLVAFSGLVTTPGALGPAVLRDVDSVTFVFNGGRKTANIDFEVTQLATVATVPEPASATLMALAGGGFAVLAVRMRRRRKSPSTA